MALLLEQEGRNVKLSIDLTREAHQVFYIGGYEFAFGNSPLFDFLAHILKNPGEPKIILLEEGCPNKVEKTKIFIRYQPQYPNYPLAIGEKRISIKNLSWVYAFFIEEDTLYFCKPERITPQSLKSLYNSLPQELRPHYRIYERMKWFEMKIPSYNEKEIARHVLYEEDQNRPRYEMVLFKTQLGDSPELLEARRFYNRTPVHEIPEEDAIRWHLFPTAKQYYKGIDLIYPDFKEYFPEMITIKEFVQKQGINPQDIFTYYKTPLKEQTKVYFGEQLGIEDGKTFLTRCWRCGLLIKLEKLQFVKCDRCLGITIYNPKFWILRKDLPQHLAYDEVGK